MGLEGIGLAELITWGGTALVVIVSTKVTLNGTKEAVHETKRAVHETNKNVKEIGANVARNTTAIATLDERTKSHAERIDRIGARLDQ